MQRTAPLFLAFAASMAVFFFSCGPGQPTYLDRVRPLTTDQAHPRFAELIPLLEKTKGQDADDLVRTWHEYLGEAPLPLRQDTVDTFVYYDFSRTLSAVYLEASFAPGRKEPLTRIGVTGLFVRVYEVPKPAQLRYRFSNGSEPLPDPFNPDAELGNERWRPPLDPAAPEPLVQEIVGAAEPGLGGQDLRILLPPHFRRNLGWTYPLVVIVGQEGDDWTRPLAQMMRENALAPALFVSVETPAGTALTVSGLKQALEDRVVPWMRLQYRASALPSDLILVGWGPRAAKPVQAVAASRPEFWTKTWIPPEDQTLAPTTWNTLAAGYFRTLYPAVTP